LRATLIERWHRYSIAVPVFSVQVRTHEETIMLTRKVPVIALAAALLAIVSMSPAAQEKPMQGMHGMPHMSIDQQVEMAKSKEDHEAVAKRFEDEANELDKQAAGHERLAKRYRGGMGVGPKTNAASLANHCDSFVKNLRASATEAREMARLHRDVGEHLGK
jgi:hypothetical protein